MKFLISTLIGLAFGTGVFFWSSQAALRDGIYTSLIWQEIEVPNAVLGVEHSVGYDREQGFFWEELTATKAFKVELLKQLGEPVGDYQRVNGSYLPVLVFKHTWPNYPKEEDARLFIGIRKQFLAEPYTEIPIDIEKELNAAATVFIREIKERGIESEKVGEPFIDSFDFDTPQKAWKRWGFKLVASTVLACWLTLFVALKLKNQNKSVLTTPEAAPPTS
jgi:hypothetical protein